VGGNFLACQGERIVQSLSLSVRKSEFLLDLRACHAELEVTVRVDARISGADENACAAAENGRGCDDERPFSV
jgi:hypothetical protein